MELNKLFTDDRAVSPVVGVALLIAIAVILAAVIGVVVIGLGTGGANTPQAQITGDLSGSGTVVLEHGGGDPLPAGETTVLNQNTSSSVTLSNELNAGQTVDTGLNAAAGETIAVVWEDPDSDERIVIERFEA